MAEEFERISNEAIVAQYKYYSFIFLEGLRKPVETSVKIFYAPDKIRIVHLLIKILELVDGLSQTETGGSALG
jgi:hypothetical protein